MTFFTIQMVAAELSTHCDIFMPHNAYHPRPTLCRWRFWQKIWEHRRKLYIGIIGTLKTSTTDKFLHGDRLPPPNIVMRLCDRLGAFSRVSSGGSSRLEDISKVIFVPRHHFLPIKHLPSMPDKHSPDLFPFPSQSQTHLCHYHAVP